MKKRHILIWGTGARGGNAYQLLKFHRGYDVVAFGDNNMQLWGKEKFHIPILSMKDLNDFQGLDCIVIASVSVQEIKEQLRGIVNIPIYDNVDDIMFQRISIDISGFCNAKCKWCVTGRKNREEGSFPVQYMPYDSFVKLYEHLYNNGIIEKHTEIMLYSWGEPLLNKDYVNIIEFLAKQEQKFSVSTNASNVQLVKRKDAYKNCRVFIFSMPGFSQESYNHIHGLSFEKINRNIREITDNLWECGFAGDGRISFHVYQFNTHEIEIAEKFAKSLNLNFCPYFPYFNGNSMAEAYLEDRLPEKMKREAEQELYLSHVKELIKKRPSNYRCFLENIISINCGGDLVLCCTSDTDCADYMQGSVFDITSFSEMKNKRKQMLACNSCVKCRMLGIDYWMGNNPAYVKGEKI